jgi:16S rRNA G1207 methylase RsmC
MEKRYGVLIDKPPANETSAEAVEAARRNLEAIKVRLRQIGVFENLSDDFDAQYIQRPMHASEEAK